MSQALTCAVERWTRAQQTPAYRTTGVLLGVAICAAIVLSEPPDGLSVEGWRERRRAVLARTWARGAPRTRLEIHLDR